MQRRLLSLPESASDSRPGNAFSQAQSAGQFIRFNITQSNHDYIYKTLAEALLQESLENKFKPVLLLFHISKIARPAET